MSPRIKLTVTQNDKIIQTVTQTIERHHLIKSLEDFQVEANAALTKMIEELGEINEAIGDGNLEDNDEDTDDDTMSSQSTEDGMESKGHSNPKRKKN